MTTDRFGKPYGSSWAGMSMGHGRKVDGWKEGACPKGGVQPVYKPASPDGYHHFTAVSNVQSVEHFICDHCDDEYSD